jgi:NitT/TauT family transport system ATP-binding protein
VTTEPATAQPSAAWPDAVPGPVILEASGVTKTFTTPDGRALPVLDDVSFALHEGEIVALLGRSGSGKSTLLRCIAGLILPSTGTVTYRGDVLNGEMISERAPLIKAILRALHATTDGTLREGFFLDLLRRGFSADEARHQLDIAIDWGRYGEVFEYDAETGELILGSDRAKVGA